MNTNGQSVMTERSSREEVRLPPLNDDQQRALAEILRASGDRKPYLLTGYAGTGKTTLLQAITRALQRCGRKVILCAPTHKAVAVIASKVRAAGLDMPVQTIHSALSLIPDFSGPVVKFNRRKDAGDIGAECIIIDECSMISAEIFALIKKILKHRFVLYVGDPAQLPPVNEQESPTFSIKRRSNLVTIIRQAADNPILTAAHVIRNSQGGKMDNAWVRSARLGTTGVFMPADPQAWMRKAFTSLEFEQDPDRFRYLCWTNARVAEVNRIIREWRYGPNIPTPFMPGERVLLRQPIMIEIEDDITGKSDQEIIFHTNEEASVHAIREGYLADTFNGIPVLIPTWCITLEREDGEKHDIHHERDHKIAIKALKAVKAAIDKGGRWRDYHRLRSMLVKMQSVYAMTVHCSQGSTFGSVFLDVGDVRRRADSNRLECQQMLYVAVTRPSTSLMLVNT